MSATRHLLYFTVVNGAFERLKVNWLCNTVIFKTVCVRCMYTRISGLFHRTQFCHWSFRSHPIA
ncbi:hypothetical protein KIN20_023815 [Parelaphostrongylus tenuis]|uniref:Uncharacterized protein n=1 Tax=Parelaphostrongylus tenuis TaxID=148309 RepID=A0AAD5MW74_PARTN|nr:hypothetical protein KIN20_023815 [Parelaphostrongylus tenuis]